MIIASEKSAPTESPARKRPISRIWGTGRSRSAAAWAGISLRKISHPSGRIDRTIAAAQERKTPRVKAAKPARSSSLPSENTALPTGTQTALRSPVSTPSCKVSTAQATEASTKTTPDESPPSGS